MFETGVALFIRFCLKGSTISLKEIGPETFKVSALSATSVPCSVFQNADPLLIYAFN